MYVIINGLLGDFLFQNLLETAGYSKAKIVGLELLVPFSLYRGLYEMAAFGTVASQSPRGTTDGVGITWAKARAARRGGATRQRSGAIQHPPSPRSALTRSVPSPPPLPPTRARSCPAVAAWTLRW